MNRMARAVCLICSEGEQSRGNLIIPSSVKSTTCVFTRLRSDPPSRCQPGSLDGVFRPALGARFSVGVAARKQRCSSDAPAVFPLVQQMHAFLKWLPEKEASSGGKAVSSNGKGARKRRRRR